MLRQCSMAGIRNDPQFGAANIFRNQLCMRRAYYIVIAADDNAGHWMNRSDSNEISGCCQSSKNNFRSFFSFAVPGFMFFKESYVSFSSNHADGIMAVESGQKFAPVAASLITFFGCSSQEIKH